MMRYLQYTKDSVITFQGSDNLGVIRYLDSNFAGCSDDMKYIWGFVFTLACGLSLGKV